MYWEQVEKVPKKKFSYLESTIIDTLNFNAEMSTRIRKAATTVGRLRKRAWNNSQLTLTAKVNKYISLYSQYAVLF